MADLVALRDYVVARMRTPGDGRPPLTVNALFEALQQSFPAGSPVSRTTLYGWLRQSRPREPTPTLLECVPAFSTALGVSEYAVLASYDERGQREYIRYNVITETLWRSLGLRWRTEPGPEWPYGDFPGLCIEVPIVERNRLPVPEIDLVPRISPDRILVLSAPFGHAELVAALVGEGLGFGTIDLRYQGFPENSPSTVVARFCREKLTDEASRYALSIAEPSDTLKLLEDDIIAAAETHLIVGISYGPRTRTLGAEVWGLSQRELLKSAATISSLLHRINSRNALISIEYQEKDYISDSASSSKEQIDFNLLTDHARVSAAEVLNSIYEKCNGPSTDTWGISFDDLRHGLSSKARVPARGTRVRWCPPGEF